MIPLLNQHLLHAVKKNNQLCTVSLCKYLHYIQYIYSLYIYDYVYIYTYLYMQHTYVFSSLDSLCQALLIGPQLRRRWMPLAAGRTAFSPSNSIRRTALVASNILVAMLWLGEVRCITGDFLFMANYWIAFLGMHWGTRKNNFHWRMKSLTQCKLEYVKPITEYLTGFKLVHPVHPIWAGGEVVFSDVKWLAAGL